MTMKHFESRKKAMNSTNEAENRLKVLQIHSAVDIALFDVSICA
ncbi:hypothetical protein T01_16038 [Trichinella spiralis]|uniref:Uncharacterized protein n=1 Tax=Trichinella spiralis TaxID=6334 RepID=A0A0V0YU22_TRISP|nr:hypothetical protein T01_16038 [Trichinella spiralis]